MSKFIENHYKKIIIVILLFIAIVSVLNAWNDSLIFDEDAHIPAGYSYVTEHDLRLNPEHPPMLKDFAGLMILPLHLKFDLSKSFWTTDINGQWDAGHDLLWQEGNNADLAIFLARIPFVILALIFGLFIFKWVQEISGTSAGIFALVLYSFDPNVLGHNHFVTTDLGIAAFMVFSFYYFLRFIKKPTWKNVMLGGIFLGLVQLAKFSSITLFPIYGLILIVYPLVKISRDRKNIWLEKLKGLGEYLGKGLIAIIISLIVIWGVYAVNIYKMPEQKLADTIEYYFPHDDSSANARQINKISLALNKSNLTRPLSGYFLGVAMVFKRVEGGNGAYFLQQVSGKAFPAYFPIVFVLKEPLIILFFMLLAISITLGRFIKSIFSSFGSWFKNATIYLRHHIQTFSLLSFILFYAYISITGNLNIGFRHLFPILPFAYILTSKVIFDFLKRLHQYTRFIWGAIITIFSMFLIAGTAVAYPYYMSYFNQLAGGPKNGYRYATDSNADWGQDLKRLKSWIDKYNWCDGNSLDSFCKIYNPALGPIQKIRVNYFGGADVKYYLKDKYIDWWDSRRPIESGWYALSTNYLMGSIYDKTKPYNESYRWTLNLKPVAQVGTSIFIYYLTPKQIAAIK